MAKADFELIQGKSNHHQHHFSSSPSSSSLSQRDATRPDVASSNEDLRENEDDVFTKENLPTFLKDFH